MHATLELQHDVVAGAQPAASPPDEFALAPPHRVPVGLRRLEFARAVRPSPEAHRT